MKKNIQYIDWAINCVYDIFSIDESGFKEIFPLDGQNIEFTGDLRKNLGADRVEELLNLVNTDPVPRSMARGIHGTLFFDAEMESRKIFFPNKRESDVRPPITRKAGHDQDRSLKYVQLIDNSEMCTYDVCEVGTDVHKILFPAPSQDIEFSGDIRKRETRTKTNELFRILRRNLVDKTTIPGIDGTIFFKMKQKKKYYPTKKDIEVAPFSRSAYDWQKIDELLNVKDGEERRKAILAKVTLRLYGEKMYY